MSNRASLNHIYRSVWNPVHPRPHFNLAALPVGIAIAWAAMVPVAHGNPAGGVAIVGQATMVTTGNQLLVTTQNGAGTNHSAINWQSFSIPAGNTTYFQQPSASSTVINRVVTNTPSQIFGTLGSNGHLVLVNQAGIAVGAGAVVDTAGFTASALRMSDADALAGRLRFGDANASAAGVSVQGSILARSGDVVLIGSSVETGADALIQAPNGSTILAAGQQIEITGRGLEGISLQVQAPTDRAINLGTLNGDAVGIFAGTLKHSGAIQATAATLEGGRVVLKALEQVEVGGRVGAIRQDGVGGQVHVTAKDVVLKSGALIDVSGPAGGGEALIGGGWQGHDTRVTNARTTTAESGSVIKANATDRGNGGTVVVWADESTRVGSRIEARGGAQGGNGGSVETSGKGRLVFRASVDTSAPQGKAGFLLLDPQDILIVGGTGAVDDFRLSDNQILANEPDTSTDVTISELALEGLSGNVTLLATRDVILGNLADNVLDMNLVTGGSTFTITAGRDITGLADVNDRVQTNGGAVAMTTTSGQINIGGIRTKGGNVTLNAGGASGNLVVRELTTTPTVGNGGNISLTSGGFTTLGGANVDASGSSGSTGNVTIVSGGAVNMQTGNTIFANDLNISAVGGIINSSSGAVAIQAARVRAINSGSGDIKLQHTGANGIAIHDLGGGTTPGINNSVAGGKVDVSSTVGLLTVGSSVLANAGDIVLSADKMDIASNVNSGGSSTGTVTLQPWNNGTAISLGVVGDTTNSTLELSQAELQNVTTGILKIGAIGYTGGIAINGAIAPTNVGTLSLINGGSISQSAGATITAGTLNAHGATGVSLTEANVVGTLAGRVSTGNFSFTNAGNLVVGTADINSGVVNLGGGNVSLASTSGALSLTQAVTASAGTISLAGPGGISQSGAGIVTAATLSLTNGAGGSTLNGANVLSSVSLTGTGGAISLNNTKATYSLSVGTVSNLSITGTGVMNVGSWVNAGNVSLSSNGGISATNINTSGTLGLASSGGAISVVSSGALTVTTASGTSVALSSSGAGLTINGNVTATGNITLGGYSSVVLSGAGVSSSSGTVGISATMGGVTIGSGSYVSGAGAITLGSSSGTVLDASVLKPGGAGGIGTLTVNGNLTLQGGATIAMDVSNTTTFDTVNVTGTLNAATPSETLSVADLSGGVTTGALSASLLTATSITGSPLVFSGPANWTMAATATAFDVTASQVAAATTTTTATQALPGVTVAEFIEKFEAALQAQQDSTDEQGKAKDTLVVEGDICRP